MQTIVVGYDGSPKAKRALLRAADLMGRSGELVVVTAIAVEDRGPTMVGEVMEVDPDEQQVEQLSRLVADAKATLGERRVNLVPVEVFGDPALAIVEAAAKHQAELIVIGRHGHHPIEHFLLRSVTAKVLDQAPCDVLVVR